MHEYSLATEILDAALEAAGDSPAGAITTVHVTLGGGSHLDREVLTEAFAMAAAGTRAEGAILQVEVSASGGRGAAVTAIDLSE